MLRSTYHIAILSMDGRIDFEWIVLKLERLRDRCMCHFVEQYGDYVPLMLIVVESLNAKAQQRERSTPPHIYARRSRQQQKHTPQRPAQASNHSQAIRIVFYFMNFFS